MLHIKFQGHWSIGSVEEDFLRFLPYMGMVVMSFLKALEAVYEIWLQSAQ